MSMQDKTKKSTYKDLFWLDNGNTGVDGTVRRVKTGNGASTSCHISSRSLVVNPDSDTSSLFLVKSADNEGLFSVDSTNDLVKAGLGQHIVNTHIAEWLISSGDAAPSISGAWNALNRQVAGRPNAGAAFSGGTGSTPADSFTISADADDVLISYFRVPVDITVQSVIVHWASSTATGDANEFCLMSYSMRTTNDATGGDLSVGVRVAQSAAAISGDGYEQVYTDLLTLTGSNVDVAEGKVLVLFCKPDGTNSDLSINAQVKYNYR